MRDLSMMIAQSVVGVQSGAPGVWSADWEWGLPLIVITVVIHAMGLGFINRSAVAIFGRRMGSHYPTALFAVVMSTVILLATILHVVESAIWAVSYQVLGAQPDYRSAVLFSLGAMTTFGNALSLEERWRLMGALEALNGWLLFGLTTAYLFGTIQKYHQIETRQTSATRDQEAQSNA
jgi:Ca2+/Na+ antiporter